MTEHETLVDIGRMYLSRYSPVVVTELVAAARETADVLAFNTNLKRSNALHKSQYDTVLIECKTSRQDFFRDSKKAFRREPERGMASFRYFLTKPGLLSPSELPLNWGLLEVRGTKQITMIKSSMLFLKRNMEAELDVLRSTLQRVGDGQHPGMNIKQYILPTGRTATLTLNPEWYETCSTEYRSLF